mgnify:FL=1
MAQFYKELTELRKSRKITLEEISERTKINIQYLQAIESGDFSDIEMPYLRLFLRAYAEEIGGDSQRALEQLDSFMGTSRPKAISPTPLSEEEIYEDKKENDSSTFLSNKNLRQDYIKGGIISLIFIFSIIVFQKIFNEESKATVSNSGPVLQKVPKVLNKQDLLKDYLLVQTSEESLNIIPPFFVKLKTLNEIGFTYQNDTLKPISKIINANREQDLDAFIEKSEIIFATTVGLSLFINSFEIESIANYANPLKLTINPIPPSMVIQRYRPLP